MLLRTRLFVVGQVSSKVSMVQSFPSSCQSAILAAKLLRFGHPSWRPLRPLHCEASTCLPWGCRRHLMIAMHLCAHPVSFRCIQQQTTKPRACFHRPDKCRPPGLGYRALVKPRRPRESKATVLAFLSWCAHEPVLHRSGMSLMSRREDAPVGSERHMADHRH